MASSRSLGVLVGFGVPRVAGSASAWALRVAGRVATVGTRSAAVTAGRRVRLVDIVDRVDRGSAALDGSLDGATDGLGGLRGHLVDQCLQHFDVPTDARLECRRGDRITRREHGCGSLFDDRLIGGQRGRRRALVPVARRRLRLAQPLSQSVELGEGTFRRIGRQGQGLDPQSRFVERLARTRRGRRATDHRPDETGGRDQGDGRAREAIAAAARAWMIEADGGTMVNAASARARLRLAMRVGKDAGAHP